MREIISLDDFRHPRKITNRESLQLRKIIILLQSSNWNHPLAKKIGDQEICPSIKLDNLPMDKLFVCRKLSLRKIVLNLLNDGTLPRRKLLPKKVVIQEKLLLALFIRQISILGALSFH